MDVKRCINVRMWSDSWFEALPPDFKLVWVYLLSNEYTNMLGVYELSLKRTAYDTGLEKETLSKAFEGFAKDSKAFYLFDKWVVLPNFLKNQSLNPNMLKSAMQIYRNLPKELKEIVLFDGEQTSRLEIVKPSESISKDTETLSNRSETLSKGSQTLSEKEIEKESEIEKEKENIRSINTSMSFSDENDPEEVLIPEEVEDLDINKREKNSYIDIVTLYNQICVSLPKVVKITKKRKKAINARLKNYTIEEIKRAFELAEESDFMKGSNNRNWIADFDWMILHDGNLAKVLELKYNKNKTQNYGNIKNIRFVEPNQGSTGQETGNQAISLDSDPNLAWLADIPIGCK